MYLRIMMIRSKHTHKQACNLSFSTELSTLTPSKRTIPVETPPQQIPHEPLNRFHQPPNHLYLLPSHNPPPHQPPQHPNTPSLTILPHRCPILRFRRHLPFRNLLHNPHLFIRNLRQLVQSIEALCPCDIHILDRGLVGHALGVAGDLV